MHPVHARCCIPTRIAGAERHFPPLGEGWRAAWPATPGGRQQHEELNAQNLRAFTGTPLVAWELRRPCPGVPLACVLGRNGTKQLVPHLRIIGCRDSNGRSCSIPTADQPPAFRTTKAEFGLRRWNHERRSALEPCLECRRLVASSAEGSQEHEGTAQLERCTEQECHHGRDAAAAV